MRNWLRNRSAHQNGSATSAESVPLVVTEDWETAAAKVTVIDIDEFEAAHDNPEWREFCERAEEYVAAVERQLQAH